QDERVVAFASRTLSSAERKNSTVEHYYSKWPEVAFAFTVTTDAVIRFLATVFSREEFLHTELLLMQQLE
ncbi:hypothetical protein XENOCAPTIV_013050, partial [Xenoophorus captivus]